MKKLFLSFVLLLAVTLMYADKYYWVGNGGNWSDYSNHWATTSGGTSFHTSVPGSTDTVYFDANSFDTDNQTVTLDVSGLCYDIVFTGVTNQPTFQATSNSYDLLVYGQPEFSSGVTYDLRDLHFVSDSSGNIFELGGTNSLGNYANLFFEGSGEWTFSDSLQVYTIFFKEGTLHLGSLRLNVDNEFDISGVNSKTLNLDSSVIYATQWDFNAENIAINKGTSTIYIDNVFESDYYTGSVSPEYHTLILDKNNTGTIKENLRADTLIIREGASLSIQYTDTLFLNHVLFESSKTNLATLKSSSINDTAHIQVSNDVSIEFAEIENITALGASEYQANNSSDNGGNSGWSFPEWNGTHYYWVGDAGFWSDTSHWATTSGGGVKHDTPPSRFDSVFVDQNSFSTDNQYLYIDQDAYARYIDFTGVTNNPEFKYTGSTGNELYVYGGLNLHESLEINFWNVYLYVNDTVDVSIPFNGNDFLNYFFKYGEGKINLTDSSHINNTRVFSGSLEVNQVNTYLGDFDINSGGSKNINFTDARVYTYNWEVNAPSQSTLNLNNADVHVENTFTGGDKNYDKVIVNGESALIEGSNSFETLVIKPGTDLDFQSGTTQTIDSLVAKGERASMIALSSSSSGSTATISQAAGTVTGEYLTIQDMVATGGATFNAGLSEDNGNNSGWNFTSISPRNYYWVGNGGSWSDTANWADTSGGSSYYGELPGASDTVIFDNNSFSGDNHEVILDVDAYFARMDWSANNNEVEFNYSGSSSIYSYGAFILDEQVSSNLYNIYLESGADSVPIVSGNTGLGSNARIYLQGGGTFELLDSISLGYLYVEDAGFHTNNNAINAFDDFRVTDESYDFISGSSDIYVGDDWMFYPANRTYDLSGTTIIFDNYTDFYGDYNGTDTVQYGTIILKRSNNDYNHQVLIDTLILMPDAEIRISYNDTLKFNHLEAKGTKDNPVHLKSSSSTTQAHLYAFSDTVNIHYAVLDDLDAAGPAIYNAIESTDNGNNTGWNFIADTIPPEIEENYPMLSKANETSAEISFIMNEGGVVYLVVLDNGADAPAVDEVVDGTGSGGASAVFADSVVVSDFTEEYASQISDLSLETEYDLYFIARDNAAAKNFQDTTSLFEFSTSGLLPPEFTNGFPYLASIEEGRVEYHLSMNEPGKVYWVIVADTAEAPDIENILNGKGKNGFTAIKSGSYSLSEADNDYSGTISGLTGNTSYDIYFVAEDDYTTPNVQSAAVSIAFTTAPMEPPQFYTGYPTNPTDGDSYVTFNVRLNEAGTAYYVVLNDGDPAPSASEVKNGQANGGGDPVNSGKIEDIPYYGSQSATIQDLTPATQYDLYVVAEDIQTPPNLQSDPLKLDFSTAVDVTAPEFETNYPTTVNTLDTSATLRVKLNEPGMVYYVVVSDGAAAPSVTEVTNGEASGGGTPIAGGNIMVADRLAYTDSVIYGLSPETSYDVYLVAEDDESSPNVQASTTLYEFTSTRTPKDYYWIGNGGNWTDLNHWATSSGGSTLHTELPTAIDNVYFDENSFTEYGEVDMNTSPVKVNNMDWTGVQHSPYFDNNCCDQLHIHGSLTVPELVNFDSYYTYLVSDKDTATISIQYDEQDYLGRMYLQGTAVYHFTDSIRINNEIFHTSGELFLQNEALKASEYNSLDNSKNKKVTLLNADLHLGQWWNNYPAVTELDFDQGKLFIADDFEGGNEQYDHVVLSGSNAIVYDNNSFNILEIKAGAEIEFDQETTQTMDSLIVKGNRNKIIKLSSTSEGNKFTLIQTSDIVKGEYLEIKDSYTSGGEAFIADNSIDLGNNSGWDFSSFDGRTYYWTGNTGRWNNISNWSSTSGGTPDYSELPGKKDTVVFDENSFNSEGHTVTYEENIFFARMDWSDNDDETSFEYSNNADIQSYGSIIMNSRVTSNLHDIFLKGNQDSILINSANKGFGSNADLFLEGGGTYYISGDSVTFSDLYLYEANLHIDESKVNAYSGVSVSNESINRSFHTGASVFYIDDDWRFSPNNVDYDFGETMIIMNSGDFYPDQNNTYDVEYGKVIFRDGYNDYYNQATIDTLIIESATTIGIQANDTLKFNHIKTWGTKNNQITLQSASSGTQAEFFSLTPSDTINIKYANIKDIHAVGDATYNAVESNDNGNNTGWNFLADTIPPMFASGYPVSDYASETVIEVSYEVTENGTVYGALYADSDPAPSIDDVINQTDAIDGFQQTGVEINAAYHHSFSNLTAATDYSVYLIAEDEAASPNLQDTTTRLDVSTTGQTPPVFMTGYPFVDDIEESSVDLNVSLNEPGKVYYAVQNSGDDAPGVSSVMNETAPNAIRSGLMDIAAAEGTNSVTIAGLQGETTYDVYFLAEDQYATPNVQDTTTLIQVTTNTLLPPVFSTGFPNVSDFDEDYIQFGVKMDEPGTAYYVVLSDGTTAPSVNEVKTGTGPGGSDPIRYGTINIASGETAYNGAAYGLDPVTAYDIYFVAEDNQSVPNLQISVALVEQTTSLDVSEPVFITDFPEINSIIDTAATLRVQLDEPGTVYYVVEPAAASAPSITEVQNGQASGGGEPEAAGTMNVSVYESTVDSLVTGLSAETSYKIYLVAKDDEVTPNTQTTLEIIEFTTTETPMDYYWIGNSGNWSDAGNWALTSGGDSLHTEAPKEIDNVYFDENSFTSDNQTVTVDINQAKAKNMDWSGVKHFPRFYNTNSLEIYGSLMVPDSVDFDSFNNYFYADGDTSYISIDYSSGDDLNYFYFYGNATFVITDSVKLDLHLNHYNGELYMNDVAIKAGKYVVNDDGSKTLTMDNAQLYVNDFSNHYPDQLDMNLHNASFYVYDDFTGGSRSYDNVILSGTSANVFGSNDFNMLTLLPGAKVLLDDGTTQTVDTLVAEGQRTNLISIFSDSKGNKATIHSNADTVKVAYVKLRDSWATGTATFIADNSEDQGNNIGWSIHEIIPIDYYWIGDGGNWSDLNHWATTSGGSTLHTSLPSKYDDVYFDENSFTTENQVVNINQSPVKFHNMDWTGAQYAPRLDNDCCRQMHAFGSITVPESVEFDSYYLYLYSKDDTAHISIKMDDDDYITRLYFYGTANYFITDSIYVSSYTYHHNGNIHFSDVSAYMGRFNIYEGNEKEVNFDNANVRVSYWNHDGPNTTTLNFNNSRLYVDKDFEGRDKTYGEVYFTGQSDVDGSNTFSKLVFMPGSEISLPAHTTQTTDELVVNGKRDKPISIESTGSGIHSTISQPNDTVFGNYLVLKDSRVTGGAVFYADNAIDNGNNDGWIMTPFSPRNYYWVGDGGSWDDLNHWATTSGGSTTYDAPAYIKDTVIFDEHSFTRDDETVELQKNIGFARMDWRDNDDAVTFKANGYDAKSHGSIYLGNKVFANLDGVTLHSDFLNVEILPGKNGLGAGSDLYLRGEGEYELMDSLAVNYIYMYNGTFKTNGHPVSLYRMYMENGTDSVFLDKSNLYVGNYWEYDNTTAYFDAGQSHIHFDGTYFYADNDESGIPVYNKVSFNSTSYLYSSASIDTLMLLPGASLYIDYLDTLKVEHVIANGTAWNPIDFGSTNSGNRAELYQASGEVNVSYANLINMKGVGGATFNAIESNDNGNNLNWNFINDTVPPVFMAGYPSQGDQFETTSSARFKLSEGGMVYAALYEKDTPSPHVDDVINGAGALDYQSIDVNDQYKVYEVTFSNLASDTEYDLYFFAEDDAGTANIQDTTTKLVISTSGQVPPVFENGYPFIANVMESSFDIKAKINESGMIYYVILPDGADAPSVSQVLNGEDGSGTAALLASAKSVSNPDNVQSINISGLSGSTAYDVYLLAEDDFSTPNVQDTTSLLEVTTDMMLPPEFYTGTPNASQLQEDYAEIRVRLDEPGTVYYVLLQDGASGPTVSEVMAGTAAGGTDPLASGTIDVSNANTYYYEELFDLMPVTAYDIYLVAQDYQAVPNIQDSTILVEITTPGDVNPPENQSGFPKQLTLLDTTATLTVSYDEPGKAYYVVIPADSAAPSVSEIISGQAAGGKTPLAAGEIQIQERDVSYNIQINGLKAETEYKAYFAAEDDEATPNVQESSSQVQFTTTQTPKDYYWIGNSGNWNDLNHWATESGGSTLHTELPSKIDDVYFDENSFTLENQTVTNRLDPVSVKNMDWTGVKHFPRFDNSNYDQLRIYGSLSVPDSVEFDSYYTYFYSYEDTAEISISVSDEDDIYVMALYGTAAYAIQDSLRINSDLRHYNGELLLQDAVLKASVYRNYNTDAKKVTLTNGQLYLSDWRNYQSGSTELTLHESVFHIIDEFSGGDEDYETVIISGSSPEIYGSNSFEKLEIASGTSLTVSAGTTQSIDTLVAIGKRDDFIDIYSTNEGQKATFSSDLDTIRTRYISLQDIWASGTAEFIADDSKDKGNNNGWTINPIQPLDYYWIGDGGNWSDLNHWATESGGTETHEVPPSEFDHVYFDENSFSQSGEIVSVDENIHFNNMDWSGVPYAAEFDDNNRQVYASGSIIIPAHIDYEFNYLHLTGEDDDNILSMAFDNDDYIRYMYMEGNGTYAVMDSIYVINFYHYRGKVIIDSVSVNFRDYTTYANSDEKELNVSNGKFWVTYFDNDNGDNLTMNFDNSPIIVSSRFTGRDAFKKVIIRDNTYVNDDNSFEYLRLNPGATVLIEGGTTQTVDTLIARGEKTNPVTIQSNNPGTQATIKQTTDTVHGEYLIIQDNIATGGAFFLAEQSEDKGNNSGWQISEYSPKDYYWIGGSGEWSDIQHWSHSSGGPNDAETLPFKKDTVIFDENSFNADGQSVTIDEITEVGELNLTKVNRPIELNAYENVYVYGSLYLNEHVQPDFSNLYLHATDEGNVIYSGENNLLGHVYIENGGGYTLMDSISAYRFYIRDGEFHSGDNPINMNGFFIQYNHQKDIDFGHSTIYLSSRWAFDAKNTTIDMSNAEIYFNAGGTNYFFGDQENQGITYNTLRFGSTGNYYLYDYIHADTLIIQENAKLNINTNDSVKVNALLATGTKSNMLTLRSRLSGYQVDIIQENGEVNVSYLNIRDINAKGGATFNAIESNDNGNNAGWNFISDTVPPVYISGYPDLDNVTETKAEITVQFNEGGDVYGVVLPADSAAPSLENIINGHNALGENAVSSDNESINLANSEYRLIFSGLDPETNYNAYLVAQDEAGTPNLQDTSVNIAFSTTGTTAPEFMDGYPYASNIRETSFDINVMLNETGTAYYVVLDDTASAPEVSEIKNLRAAGGKDPLVSGTINISDKNNEYSNYISSNLKGETDYKLYMVAEDDFTTPNLQDTATVLSVSTAPLAPPVFYPGYPDLVNNFDNYIRVRVRMDEAGIVYYVVLPDGADVPEVQEVLNGEGAGGIDPVASGQMSPDYDGDYEYKYIYDLEPETGYDIYFVAEDNLIPANLQDTVSLLEVTTNGDGTAPSFVFSSPKTSRVKDTSFALTVALDEPGEVFFVVLPADSTTPSVDSVLAGKSAAGYEPLAAGSIITVAREVESDSLLSGFKESTEYKIHTVARDDESFPNTQTTMTSITVTTTASPKDYYWIGDGGNWSDTSHWATSPGGTTKHLTPPTRLDNVFFDEHSFSNGNQKVSVNGEYEVHTIDMRGARFKPEIESFSNFDVYGSAFIPDSVIKDFSNLRFYSDENDTIAIKSRHNDDINLMYLYGTGSYISTDSLKVGRVNLYSGDITLMDALKTSNTYIYYGDKPINLEINNANYHTNNVYHNAPGHFNMMTSNRANFIIYNYLRGSGAHFGNVMIPDGRNVRIDDNNSFDTLRLGAGSELSLQHSSTQDVARLIAKGKKFSYTIIQTNSAGSSAQIKQSADTVHGEFLEIRDINATGGAEFIARSSLDLGNNQGWTFIGYQPVDYYWIGGTGNWTDLDNWSSASGGNADMTELPGRLDNAIFDENSFDADNQTVTVNQDVSIYNLNWAGAEGLPTLFANNANSLDVYGSLWLTDSMTYNVVYTYFRGDSSGKEIYADKEHFNDAYRFEFYEGDYEVRDSLSIDYIVIYSGGFNTNDHPLNLSGMNIEKDAYKNIHLGRSIIHATNWELDADDLTLDADEATINITNGDFWGNRDGYDVKYGHLILEGNIHLLNNADYDTLEFRPGSNIEIGVGSTINVDHLIANGEQNNRISLASVSNGGSSTISKASGTVNASYLDIRDNTVTGGATFNATFSDTISNVSGWNLLKVDQTISFAFADTQYTVQPLILDADAESGGTVTYEVISGAATVNHDTLLLESTGTIELAAYQSGTSYYLPSDTVTTSFEVLKGEQVIAFDSVPPVEVTSGYTILEAEASSELDVVYEVLEGNSNISGDTLFVSDTGMVKVKAKQGGSELFYAADSVIRDIQVIRGSQSITFPAITGKHYESEPFIPVVTASSGLPVKLEVKEGNAYLLNDSLYITGTGEVSLLAAQVGNEQYLPADTVEIVFEVDKASQVITFDAIADKTYGDEPFELSASASSGLEVVFEALSSNISVTGDTVIINGGGEAEIRAYQTGNDNYHPSDTARQQFTVNQAVQTISMDAIDDKQVDDDPFKLNASASSGLPLDFEVSGSAQLLGSDSIQLTGDTGRVWVKAIQSGNADYQYASDSIFFTVNGIPRTDQVISFASIADQTYGNTPVLLQATASSGLPVSFEVTEGSDLVQLSNDSLYILGPGDVTIKATQSGNEEYVIAEPVLVGFTIHKIEQQITFHPIADKTYGDEPFAIDYSSTSGLPVMVEHSNNIAIMDDTVFILEAGPAEVFVYQEEDEFHQQSDTIVRSFEIGKAEQVLSHSYIPDKIITDPNFVFTASSSSGLPVAKNIEGPATFLVSDSISLTGDTGQVTILLSHPGNMNYEAVMDSLHFFVSETPKTDQTISFAEISDKVFGDSAFSPGATASSGLAVEYKVIKGNVSLSNDSVYIHGAGEVIIEAIQEGNENFAKAVPVRQTFNVAKAGQTITIASIDDKFVSDEPFAIEAEASSGLPLFIDVDGPATLTGNDTLVLSGDTGKVTIRIEQPGDPDYQPVVDSLSFSVTETLKMNQSIIFSEITDKVYGVDAFTLNANASSGLDVEFRIIEGHINISNDSVFILGAGEVTIEAYQGGNDQYNEAIPVRESFTVSKAEQMVSIASIDNKLITDEPFSLELENSSGLPLNVSVSGPAQLIGEDTLALTGDTGEVVVSVTQPGNDNYNPFDESLSFRVTSEPVRMEQQITFNMIAEVSIEAESIDMTAIASSGLPVSFLARTDNISVNGNQVTLLEPGKAEVVAVQQGDNTYKAADSIAQVFCINPSKPVISLQDDNGALTLLSDHDSGNQWYFNGNALAGENKRSLEIDEAGWYSVQVSVDGCSSPMSDEMEIDSIPTAINHLALEEMRIYPNPASSVLKMDWSNDIRGAFQLNIYNIVGEHKLGKVIHLDNQSFLQIDINELASGSFILELKSEDFVLRKQFIKR